MTTEASASPPRRFALHVALLALVLLLGAPVMHTGATGVPDEGLYLAQADALTSGSWWIPRPAPEIDTDGIRDAIRAEVTTRSRSIPYARHPLFSMLLAGPFAIGGHLGVLIAIALCTWAAAVTSALIARELRAGLDVPVLWLVGIGSPLIYDAYFVSAHAGAAAACGLAFLGLHRTVQGRSTRPLWYALPAVALLVSLRSEGAIVMAATAVVLGVEGLARWLRDRSVRQILIATSVMAVAAVTYLIDGWATHVIADAGPRVLPTGRVADIDRGPWNAAWASLLRPGLNRPGAFNAVLVLCLASLVAAALALRVLPKRPLATWGLLGMATVAAVLMHVEQLEFVSGVAAAWPILIPGLILLGRPQIADPLVRNALAISALSGIVIVFTIYEDGGATQWGGRFFHLLIPLVAPVVAWSIDRRLAGLPRRSRDVSIACLAVIVVSFSALSLRMSYSVRSGNHRVVETTYRYARAHRPAGRRALVIVVPRQPDGTTRYFWDPPPQVDVVLSMGASDLFPLLVRARDAGYRQVTVLSSWEVEALVAFDRDEQLRSLGWAPREVTPIPGRAFELATFGPAPSP